MSPQLALVVLALVFIRVVVGMSFEENKSWIRPR